MLKMLICGIEKYKKLFRTILEFLVLIKFMKFFNKST